MFIKRSFHTLVLILPLLLVLNAGGCSDSSSPDKSDPTGLRLVAVFENGTLYRTTGEGGGATFPEYTIYQVVAVPADLTIWLKAHDYSGWERIELKQLFAASP